VIHRDPPGDAGQLNGETGRSSMRTIPHANAQYKQLDCVSVTKGARISQVRLAYSTALNSAIGTNISEPRYPKCKTTLDAFRKLTADEPVDSCIQDYRSFIDRRTYLRCFARLSVGSHGRHGRRYPLAGLFCCGMHGLRICLYRRPYCL
jgi:hypothetical protein